MAYHHGRLRESAIRAALEHIEAAGEANLSLRALARELGVSSAALYRHFADREEILDAVSALGRQQLAETLQESVNWAVHPKNGDDAEHRLETVVHHHLAFAENRPRLFRLMLRRPGEGPEETLLFLKRAIEDLAARRRRVKPPQEQTVRLAQSLLEGVSVRYADGTKGGLEEALVSEGLLRILS